MAPTGGDFAEVIHRCAGELSENRARDWGVGFGVGVWTAQRCRRSFEEDLGERYEQRAKRVCEANRCVVARPWSWENGDASWSGTTDQQTALT